MISGISGNEMMMPPMQRDSGGEQASLTTEQEELIASILSEYDASNLSAEDASSIVASFEAAGIEPSRAMADAMSENGFSAREIGDLAGVGGRGEHRMPPPPPQEEVAEVSSLLDTLLNTSEEDENSATSVSFEDVMEYTSRIIHLNDSSKTEVMNILDKYSSEESEYTDNEIKSLVKSSLEPILSNQDNYNRTSILA